MELSTEQHNKTLSSPPIPQKNGGHRGQWDHDGYPPEPPHCRVTIVQGLPFFPHHAQPSPINGRAPRCGGEASTQRRAGRRGAQQRARREQARVVAAGAVLPPLLVADGIDVVLERLCAARVERVEHGRAADGAVDERVHAVGCVVRGPSGLVAAALGETVEDRGREDVPRVRVRDHRLLLLLLCLLLPWGWGG